MLNLANVICLKLRSNSGRRLNDNQLEYISNHNDIPLDFLREMRETNYFKIYFEKTKDNKSNTTIKLIAHSNSTDIYFLGKFNNIPAILKAQIKILETVKIPKENVSVEKAVQHSKKTTKDNLSSSKVSVPDKKKESKKSWDEQKSKDFSMLTQNVVKVDLRMSKDVLIDTFRKMNIHPQTAIHDKEEFDILFFQLVDNKFHQFAFIRKGQKGIEFTKNYYRALSKLEAITAENIVREPDLEVNFDLDSILDKISKYGIESLTQSERDFLDNHSK
jgi:hypothetical protein